MRACWPDTIRHRAKPWGNGAFDGSRSVMRRWVLALAIAVAAGTPSLPAMAQGENLGYRLTVLEEQVRQLVGQIQELQHQLHQIEARGGAGGAGGSGGGD